MRRPDITSIAMTTFSKRARCATAQAEQARDKDTLCGALDQMVGVDGRVARPGLLHSVLAVSLFGTGVLLVNFDITALGVGMLSAGVVFLANVFRERASRTRFIDAVLRQATFLDNGLVPVKVDGNALWREWRARFPDFQRGDEGQEIDGVSEGTLPGPSGAGLKFSCYRFSYVEVRETTSTDADGESTTETTRATYYRYGLVASLPAAPGIVVSAIRKPRAAAKWTTSSIEFNKAFHVGARSEMHAARVLTPTLVQAIVALGGRFRRLDIHMIDDLACVSFDDADLLSRQDAGNRSDSIKDIKDRVRASASVPKLSATLKVLSAVAAVARESTSGAPSAEPHRLAARLPA